MLNPLSSPAALDRAAAEELSKGWWILAISGLVSVIAGILILTIKWTVSDLALFVAILFIVRGIFQAGSRTIDGSGRGWNIFVGVLEIIVGIAFLAWSGPTLLVLAIFIGAWIIVTGIFDIIGAIANRNEVKLWWLFLIFGVIEVILGMVLLDRPALTLALAVALVGIWAIVVGIFQIVAGFEIKNLPEKLDL